MPIDPDIGKFVEAIGANEPQPNDKIYGAFRKAFKRHNYFLLEGRLLIIKVSKSKKPFWGVGREILELVNGLDNYFLVLLMPSCDGWVFSKSEVNARVAERRWNLGQDDDYKINLPLPDSNTFGGPKSFRRKIGVTGS